MMARRHYVRGCEHKERQSLLEFGGCCVSRPFQGVHPERLPQFILSSSIRGAGRACYDGVAFASGRRRSGNDGLCRRFEAPGAYSASWREQIFAALFRSDSKLWIAVAIGELLISILFVDTPLGGRRYCWLYIGSVSDSAIIYRESGFDFTLGWQRYENTNSYALPVFLYVGSLFFIYFFRGSIS